MRHAGFKRHHRPILYDYLSGLLAMLNLGQLVNTVQKNCHISDARHAGDFTLCIFLLKMREFFRWENDIPFARDLPKEEVGAWLQEREGLWSDLESSSFESLLLEGRHLDPFDADTINRELIPQGYVYSGGYGRFSKPHFFLGSLLKKEKPRGLHDIYFLVRICARPGGPAGHVAGQDDLRPAGIGTSFPVGEDRGTALEPQERGHGAGARLLLLRSRRELGARTHDRERNRGHDPA